MKINNTKKQRKAELLRKLTAGPSIYGLSDGMSKEDILKHFHIWLDSWIIPEVKDLIKIPGEE